MHLCPFETCASASYAPAWRHPAASLNDIWDPERYEHLSHMPETARLTQRFSTTGSGHHTNGLYC